MSRSYKEWMGKIVAKKRACPDLNLVIRHDVDFDIVTGGWMLEIERSIGLSSVVYLDIHSPSYGLYEIVELYKEFQDSHEFGIHINVAYDHVGKEECYQAFDDDLRILRDANFFPHSCAAHYYNTSILPVPEFHNGHVESWSHNLNLLQQEYYPRSFHHLHFNGVKTKNLTDGGATLPKDGMEKFLENLEDTDKAYMSFHPIHFERNGTDVVYAKKISGGTGPRKAQESISQLLTPYLKTPMSELPHLYEAHRIIATRARERYREAIRVIDAGCGIGLLGAYLVHYNNLKYTGFDIEPKFVHAGQVFFDLQGYCPKLYAANIYDHQPEGDILAFLGYEDCDTDYDELFGICLKYPEVLVTIVSESMRDRAKDRGKQYEYIGEEAFEAKFKKAFDVIEKIPVPDKRTLYYLKRSLRD